MSKNPAWKLVSSSAIEAVAYDEQSLELRVRFLPSHQEYIYENVTQSEHTALITAGSIGKHFNAHIKTQHVFRKSEGTEEN